MRLPSLLKANFCLLVIFLGALPLFAQGNSNKQMVEKARALYYSGPMPGSIACDATIDWDAFIKQLGAPQDEETQKRLAPIKAVSLSFVSHDESHTEVKISGPEGPTKQLGDGLRQQISGFFQMFWSLGYGGLLPAADSNFEVESVPDGYVVTQSKAGTKTIVQMDRTYKITKAHVDTSAFVADMMPTFATENDGLLHLRGIAENIEMGQTKISVEITFDNQRAGIFYVPHHLRMGLTGSYGFSYEFSGCQVLDKNNVPAKTVEGSVPATR